MDKLTKKMRSAYKSLDKRTIVVGALLIAFILIAISGHQTIYKIGSDAMSYISIAEHYARGDIKVAVNGYWSPMISWLMTPLIFIGIDGREAFAFVNVLSAITILVIGSAIVWRATKQSLLPALTFIVIMTIFLRSVVDEFFPDLLLVAWSAVFILTIMLADKLADKRRLKTDICTGLILGLVGAAGYMTKLYALPFFIGVIILWAFVRLLSFKEAFLRPALLTAVFLVLFASPWVAALSIKYDYLTVGSSFAINTAPKFEPVPEPKESSADVNGSEVLSKDLEKEAEQYRKVSIDAPPYPTATTTTEDRTPVGEAPGLGVNGRESISNFFEGRTRGLPAYISKISLMWYPTLFVLVATVALLAIKKYRYNNVRSIYILAISSFVYLSGYALLASSSGGNMRYYYPLLFFTAVLFALIIDIICRYKVIFKVPTVLAAAIVALFGFALTLQKYPIEIGNLYTTPSKTRIENIAEDFVERENITKHEKFVSNNGRQNREFAFFAGGQAYGKLSAGYEFTNPNLREDMINKDIEYFLHFETSQDKDINFANYGGEVVAEYYLGKNFSRCRDTRSSSKDECTLYIIKLNDDAYPSELYVYPSSWLRSIALR